MRQRIADDLGDAEANRLQGMLVCAIAEGKTLTFKYSFNEPVTAVRDLAKIERAIRRLGQKAGRLREA